MTWWKLVKVIVVIRINEIRDEEISTMIISFLGY